MLDDLFGHVMSAKILRDIIANDSVDNLEAFTCCSFLILDDR